MTYRTLGFPSTELQMQAISIDLPLTATQKGVNTKLANKIVIALCESAKPKTSVISYHRVLRVRNNICKHFKCEFTPFVVAVRV